MIYAHFLFVKAFTFRQFELMYAPELWGRTGIARADIDEADNEIRIRQQIRRQDDLRTGRSGTRRLIMSPTAAGTRRT